MTCPYAYDDGAYVLGALGPAERSAYEAHLAQCAACATAVSQLAALPGLLGRVSEEALHPARAEPSRLDRLIESVTALRRRQTRVRRWRFATALAGVSLLAVAVTSAVFGLLPDAGQVRPDLVAMEPLSPATLVMAEVATHSGAAGTRVWMVCRYPDDGDPLPVRTFRLVATGVDGGSEQLGSWRAGPGDEVDLTSLTGLNGTDLERLELQADDGTVLLTYALP